MSAMQTSKRTLLATAIALAFGWPVPVDAGQFNGKVNIGSSAPEWKGLVGSDGKKHALEHYRAATVLVIAFTANSCPVSQMYEDRFNRFVKEEGPHGVAFIAISCSLLPSDSLGKIKDRVCDNHLTFDYLFDPSQQTGRDYGATVTPQMFVLDQKRKIAYMGKFDDNLETEKVRRKYVEDAVRALLAGQRPEPSETRATGCGIEYGRPR
ncbi:MAG TPA: redoxin domain-containing protein [Planctomycetaceae bacterium]|nr:redoxin domain-containing protein [Planctomycetaceae bacterium]